MRRIDRKTTLSRRHFLSAAAGGAAAAGMAGAGRLASAAEMKALSADQMATLVQLARDLYPHDILADSYYAGVVGPYDEQAAGDAEFKQMMQDGLDLLNRTARRREGADYTDINWEKDRVHVLAEVIDNAMIQKVRSDLVVGLYNNPDVWRKFGYEGPSAEYGGYLERGFDDIDWLDTV